ncbi:MAG TPA: iron chelate uptake ABC transporter family permease subunit [Rhabdochlamydiaceae bacterium]|nr:iron chelate uptake ABC transporter family permease subunit [Rhabdochlamydiaceae bacterium]
MTPLLDFFSDPILRPSTLGCMLMCFASALVGVVVFLRKRSLIGETLSHASFPGVVIGVFVSALLMPFSDELISLVILCGAFLFAFLGLKTLSFLENKARVKADSALCFVLASFFGLGILIASRLQQTYPLWYKQALTFLYGQAATMTNMHILLYGCFSLVILGFILYFYRYLEAVNFDPSFSETLGIRSKRLDEIMFFLIVLAIVIGIRSVGVVLMAGMLIGPAVTARPLTNRLSYHFALAGAFGVASGFLGNYLSVVIPNEDYSLPTGPMILMVSSLFCFLSLLLAPRSGLITRFLRMRQFSFRCSLENALKSLWKGERKVFSSLILWKLKQHKWIDPQGTLTPLGKATAENIIRLHRLWEVYLVDYMGQKVEKVHRTAEELEHLLSPELEKELTELLHNPRHDPHHQPIPPVNLETP